MRHCTLYRCLLLSAFAFRATFTVAAEPVALDVAPAAVKLDGPRATCQLVVTGRSADGKLTDLTAAATIDPCDLVAVEPHAFLKAAKDGSAQLTIRANNFTAQIPITVTNAAAARPVGFRLE